MTSEEIRRLIEDTCRACGAAALAGRIRVTWNRRFTARMGDARWDARRAAGLIRLSAPLWPKASDAERRETVVHEACHVLADALARSPQGHGPLWRRLMALCGYPKATRCHTVDREERAARRDRNRVRAACGCPDGIAVGPVQAERLRMGVTYHCRRCRRRVVLGCDPTD